MKMWRGFVAVCGLVSVLLCFGPPARADEEPAKPAEPTGDEPATIEPLAEGEGKRHFGLYLSVAGGMAEADRVNTSLSADAVNITDSFFEIEEMLHTRASAGWHFLRNKGDVRLNFRGYKEDDYKFSGPGSLGMSGAVGALGRLPAMTQGGGSQPVDTNGVIPWWFVTIDGGMVSAQQFQPQWSFTEYKRDPTTQELILDQDGNCQLANPNVPGSDKFLTGDPSRDCNGVPDLDEVLYDFDNPNLEITTPAPDTYQNQIQTLDVLYGREFGNRRFSSHWWTGLRYFAYEGQLPAVAWLSLDINPFGSGFTDGGLFPLIRLSQNTTGWGPMGRWEVDFNFFDKGLVLFFVGEVALTINSLEVDSGPIGQLGSGTTPVSDRIVKSLDKSQWQNGFEIGARVNLTNGMSFEIGYGVNGFLDVVLTPDLLQLGTSNNDPQTSTQDYVVDVWYGAVSIQF